MLLYILLVVLWIAIAFWPARVAARKGHSFFLYFLFSLVFFPLALLVAYMVDDRTVAPGCVLTNGNAAPGEPQGPRTTVTCSPRRHSLTNSSRPSTRSETRTVVSVRSIDRTTFASTLPCLVVEVDQHDVAELEPLDVVVHRHATSLVRHRFARPGWSRRRPGARPASC